MPITGNEKQKIDAMAVDVYSTVRQFGFPISVKTDYQQAMDRYAFLMVR